MVGNGSKTVQKKGGNKLLQSGLNNQNTELLNAI